MTSSSPLNFQMIIFVYSSPVEHDHEWAFVVEKGVFRFCKRVKLEMIYQAGKDDSVEISDLKDDELPMDAMILKTYAGIQGPRD